LPTDPTSPHWYDAARFKTLIARNIAYAEDHGKTCQTVADFISEFRGLAGTAKRRDICNELGMTRWPLSDLDLSNGGDVGPLLEAMKIETTPLKPRDLGLIGEAHLRIAFADTTFDDASADMDTFRYKKAEVDVDGVPYLAEAAFAYCPGAKRHSLVTGVNWSVAVGHNPFRNIGAWQEDLGAVLTYQEAGPDEPIVFFLHLASPCLSFLDKGKSSVALPSEVSWFIRDIVEDVTNVWAKQRRREQRDASAAERRLERLRGQDRPMFIKDAAYSVMRDAYMRASADGELPADFVEKVLATGPSL
jgi:hypothetical protein